MIKNYKQSIIFGAILALIVLIFLGFIFSLIPIHTSESNLRNQFVLEIPFKDMIKVLYKKNLAQDALTLNGGKLLNEEVVYRKISIGNWNYRQITYNCIEADGAVLYLENDVNISPDMVVILTTLRKPNTKIGLRQLNQDIQISPLGDSKVVVTHNSLISVTRKCPSIWYEYMDNQVEEAAQINIKIIEYLLRQYTGA